MHRVRMLIHFGVTPYVVFDGDYLPSKSHTEKGRAERRREARRQGLSLLQAGKVQQATQELRKAVDVTPSMARDLIEELKLAGVMERASTSRNVVKHLGLKHTDIPNMMSIIEASYKRLPEASQMRWLCRLPW